MKIGIDVGGSHIGIGLLDDENKIVEKIEKDVTYEENSEELIIKYLEKNIDFLKEKNNIQLIGIALPGNVRDSYVTNLVNLGLNKIDLSHIINKYKDIQIKIKNDSKAGALAESTYGSLREYKDSVFLCLGTGIGSAVILNKRLLTSNRNTGFELGHMIIEKNGIKCRCGKRGCFETYCAIKRLKEKIKETLEIDNCTSEELLQITKDNLENVKIKKIINDYIDYMIIGLSNIIDIFEPEAISLGGSFVYFKDIFYNKLNEEMNERKYVFNKESLPKIVLATLKNDAGIIGSIL